MQTLVHGAAVGQAGPHDLGDAIGGGDMDLEAGFDFPADRVRQGCRHQEGLPEAQLGGGEAHAVHDGDEVAGQGRGGDQDRGLVIPHDHESWRNSEITFRDDRGPRYRARP